MQKQSSDGMARSNDGTFGASGRGYGSTHYIDHSLDVASSISNLFGNSAFSDVTLIVQGVQFVAHKAVLAARSEYFRALLYGGLAETSSSVIHLNDICANAFKHVLQYIYTGRINVKKLRTMLDVLGLAHQYDLRGLESALSAHLTHSLRLSNVWLVYNLAVMYNLEELVNACLKFLDGIAPAPLQSPQFLRLSQAAVERLLSRDSFCASEIQIFRSLCAWFRAVEETEARQRPAAFDSGEPPSSCDVPVRSDAHLSPNKSEVDQVKSNQIAREATCESGNNGNTSLDRTPLKNTDVTAQSKPLNNPNTEFSWLADRIEARQQQMIRRCVRFELMSLTDLLTEVRASKLVSPDDLLDAISRQAKLPDSLPHRGWMLPGVNLASPRFACSLISGEEGGYPYFFVDDMDGENGPRNLGEIQFSPSALDLTTALANGTVNPSSAEAQCEQLELDDEDDEDDNNEDDDEDEDDDDDDDGEDHSESRSRGTNQSMSLANQQRQDVVGESEAHVASVIEPGTNRTDSSTPPHYGVDQNVSSAVNNASGTSNVRVFPALASTTDQRRIPLGTQAVSNADWYPIVPPELRGTELNHYSAHVRGTHPRRNTHSFVAPHTYSQREVHQSLSRRPHLSSSLFTPNTNVNQNNAGFPNWPLVGGGRSEADRSIRWLYPVVRRRSNLPPHPPPPHSEHDVVRHSLDDPDTHIVIRLGKPSIVNTIRMQLWDREVRCYSYYIEVSLDSVTWHRIVDYRNYPCRSWQTLHFPARVIHYIRVTGTRNTANRTFHLITFRCLYTESVCQQVNGFLIPTYNVASVDHGATVLEGVSRNRNSLIDGNARMYDWNSGYTCHQLGNGSIVVQLAQPFLLRSMRLLLWDLDDRTYSYSVHVSTNREDWRLVHDATRERCRSWQIITFPLQLVTFVRVVGSHNTANEVFHLVHLECPYPPAEQQPDGRAGLLKGNENAEVHSSQSLPTANPEFTGAPTSSDAPSESNSSTEHPSYQATQATEMMDQSSVLALDAVTNSSIHATELETRPNSPPIPADLTRSDTAESLPQLAPLASGSVVNLPDPDQLPVGGNSLEPEPDRDPSLYNSSLSLDRAEFQPVYNDCTNHLSSGDMVGSLPVHGIDSEPSRPLSRHLSIGSSVCQLNSISALGLNRARSAIADRSENISRRTRISPSCPAPQKPTEETDSFDFS